MIDLTWLALRAVSLIVTFQAAGTALFVAAFAPALAHHQHELQRLGGRAALASLALLAAQALFEPLHLAGDWSGVGSATVRVFMSSSAALALCAALGGMALLTLTLRRRRALGRSGRTLAAIGSVVTLASFLLTGHTVAHRERAPLAALLFAHLAIVAFWFGSLEPLRRLIARAPPADAARVTEAFSAAAVWLVPLIALLGAGMAWLLLPDAAALLRPYGLLLLSKAALFALLLGLAALNRWRLVPALARADTKAASRLGRSIGLEYLLICVVFVVTAVMSGALSPQGD